jgi:hypothetical protein
MINSLRGIGMRDLFTQDGKDVWRSGLCVNSRR